MKNMKNMLSALTALSFVTVAGVSTVACNKSKVSDKNDDAMNNQVLLDLEVYDKNGKSQIEAKLEMQDDSVNWTVNKLNNLTALSLLTDKNKAKSKESFNFLTDVLKLQAKGDGNWSAKTFNRFKAYGISLTIVSIDPTLKAIDGDYAISEGTITVQWKNNETSFGKYSIDLKVDMKKGVIKQHLPTSSDLSWLNFDNRVNKGLLGYFHVRGEKIKLPVGSDITSNLKVDIGMGKTLAAIASKVTYPLKLTVSSFEDKDGEWDGNWFNFGDILKFKISFGPVQFDYEYQLQLETIRNKF